MKADKVANSPDAPAVWRPLENLRREIDHMFEDFGRGPWFGPLRRSALDIQPLWQRDSVWNAPAVDAVEKDQAYEVTAELPGMDQKSVEVTLRNGSLVIRGEKQEEKEEKKQDYYLQERRFGSFERSFTIPDGVDADKIEASFKNGVLKVILPKRAALAGRYGVRGCSFGHRRRRLLSQGVGRARRGRTHQRHNGRSLRPDAPAPGLC